MQAALDSARRIDEVKPCFPQETVMPLSKIAHYSIRTLDLEATRKFYTELLGFTVGPRPPFDFPGLWLYNGSHDSYDNAIVHIIGIDPNNPQGLKDYLGDRDIESLKNGTGTFDHIAFVGTDARGMAKHFAGKKVPFRERTVPSLNLHQIFLDDPSGVVIELNYPADEKAAA
jgi:catechol 2,3-dioxygenase-like lactoylglutathione lyase family enzyme